MADLYVYTVPYGPATLTIYKDRLPVAAVLVAAVQLFGAAILKITGVI